MASTSNYWSCDELVRHIRNEEPEVRYWAIDRLTRHYPEECCDAIQDFLLDDHDATPALVARHLGEYGAKRHTAILARGLRLLRGSTPALCMQALVRLKAPNVAELAQDALKSADLEDLALAQIIEALSDAADPDCNDVVREALRQKPALLVEPSALRGALRVAGRPELPATVQQCLTAMQWKGTDRAGEAFRIVMDELRIDDAAWCFRTGPSGPIELRKTIKAVEAGYDCDIQAILGESTINRLAQRFRVGNVAETIRALADWTADATGEMKVAPESDLPQRIAAVVNGFAEPTALERAQHLGPQFLQWLLGFQLSAAFAVARSQTREWTLKQARGRLEPLLELAQVETAFHLTELPKEIVTACEGHRKLRDRAQEWCLRMLEAQGPFFPKVIALETLGELQAVHFASEMMEYLSEENSYIYGAAERALAKLGEAIVPPAVHRIETSQLDPDAAHSVLVLLCDLGTTTAFEAVMHHLDWFMDVVGPGATAEWVGLFGAEELIDPLRDWLEHDKPMIGQTLLLLGAIHNVRIPEQDEIHQAIEDERARQAAAEAEQSAALAGDTDGDYVM